MPRTARKKHRLPRKSEEKRSFKYPFGLDFSLPIGDRDDDDDIISRYEEHYNQTKEKDHE